MGKGKKLLFCQAKEPQGQRGLLASPKQALVFTWLGKGEIARDEQFLLLPVFITLLATLLMFSSNSKLSSALFQFGRV